MIVYRATNTANGKSYIGITAQPLKARQAQHKSRAGKSPHAFAMAIHKYGWDAFAWDVLHECDSREELERMEQHFIALHGTYVLTGNGYNRTLGGEGSAGLVVSADTRAKLAAAMRGRTVSADTRAKLSANAKRQDLTYLRVPRPMSEQQKEKLRQLRTGVPFHHSERHAEACAASGQRRSAAQVCAKVRREDRAAIEAKRAAGMSFAAIGREYDVTPSCVFYFLKREQERSNG